MKTGNVLFLLGGGISYLALYRQNQLSQFGAGVVTALDSFLDKSGVSAMFSGLKTLGTNLGFVPRDNTLEPTSRRTGGGSDGITIDTPFF